MKCPECGGKIGQKDYDAVVLTDSDREILKQASSKIETLDPYLAGRLAGLAGRVSE